MTAIDLNANPGESYDTDKAFFALISSANTTCGWYAGDVNTARQTVGWALCQGVSIGAHPSFPDRESFGRTEMHLQPNEICAGVLFQTDGLSAIARAQGGELAHVKVHGTLYNQASHDRPLVMTIVYTIRDSDPSLVVFGPAGGELVKAMRELNLQAKKEVFVDRGYNVDGLLIKRGTPSTLTDSEDVVLDQTLTMVRGQRVEAIDGTWALIRVETICLYGDGAHVLTLVRRIRERPDSEGIAVRAGA